MVAHSYWYPGLSPVAVKRHYDRLKGKQDFASKNNAGGSVKATKHPVSSASKKRKVPEDNLNVEKLATSSKKAKMASEKETKIETEPFDEFDVTDFSGHLGDL